MGVSRSAACGLLLTFSLTGCSDHINPRDGRVDEPIPAGVSVAPQRSTPQTGGLDLPTQDTVVPTADVPGIMDTTRAAAPVPATPAAAPAAPATVPNAAPAGAADTVAAPRPR